MNVSGEDVDYLSRHFWLVPIIGLFLGAVAAVAFWSFRSVYGGLVSAVVTVLAVHALNRFLHFDGLIDLGDGLIATGVQEKRLAAMKDTRVGAGGVSFGVLFTLLVVAALSSVGTFVLFLPLAMEVLAKNALLTAAAFGREREGLGSPFVKNTTVNHSLLSALLSFLILLPLASILAPYPIGLIGLILLVLFMVAMSAVTGALMAHLANRSFGCVNGDVMGATNEIAKAVVLLTALAVLP